MKASMAYDILYIFFFSSRRRHTRLQGDWSSDVCSSDLEVAEAVQLRHEHVGVARACGRAERHDARAGVEVARGVEEIGRASCRARAYIPGVARSSEKRRLEAVTNDNRRLENEANESIEL